MESQGQPCLKGFPSTQLGAQSSNNQHGQNNTVEHQQKRNNKHRLSIDEHLSPQSKKQKDDNDKECFPTAYIDSSKTCKEKSHFSGNDKIPQNGPDDSSIPVNHYASGTSESLGRQVSGNLQDVSSSMYYELEDIRKQTADSQISKTKESEEKASITCLVDKRDFHGNIPEEITCDAEGAVSTDVHEMSQSDIKPCDIQVSTASNHSEEIPGLVSSLSSNDQDSHVYIISSPTDQHIPAEFHSQANPDENLKIHMDYDYEEMSASPKAIERYNSSEQQSEPDQSKRIPMKLDLEHLQLMNVGAGGVEYMEGLQSIVSVKSPNPNDTSKSELHSSSQENLIVRNNEQKTSSIQDSIPIQVYPQPQGISLVTSSGILTADISTFSTQVPTILTEGDADDTEAAVSFAEQFHVVTTSSALTGTSQIQEQTPSNEMLSVMMSTGDFTKGVILTPDQQQAFLGDMITSGVGQGQMLHITIPQVATVTRPLVNTTAAETTGESSQTDVQVSTSAENKTIKLQVISNNQDEMNKEINEGRGGEVVEGDKVHLCPHPSCNKVCQRAHRLKLHMLTHTGERPYKCSHEGCEWAFTTAYKLKRHERGHTGERPFVCPHEECSRRFTTAYNLKTHIRTHTRPNTIMCDHEGCDKTFPTLHKFRVHERKHQQEEKPFKCEIDGCGKEFSAMGPLTSHLKSHSGEKPHGCPMEGCCKRFTKASKLKLHLRTHTGERPFGCDFEGCGWSFTSAYKLKRHMRKHTGERPFVCVYEGCHKSFTRSSHLKTHTLVHTGEKPYVCPIDGCNKAFTAGSSLNVHMRKHTGEKPFKCEEDGCSKAYTTASNLRAHQKRHEKSAKFTEGSSEDHPMPADFVTVSTMSNVSSAGSLVDNDNEVTYTGIHTFSSEDFTTDDVTSLPVSVHFSAGSLSAIVSNRGNPLSFSSACSSSNEHTDVNDEEDQGLQNDMNSKGITTVTLPVSVDASHIDVAEFVVRNDNPEPALHGQEVSKHSDVENLKHDGGFDLSITSMVSHLRSRETSPNRKLLSSEVLTEQSPTCERLAIDNKYVPSHSRSLEFRTPMNPEDQFKPPAVIFQDDCSKSGSSDTESESSHPNPGLMQITLPQEVIQVHFPSASDSPLPPDNENPIDVDANTSHHLQSYEGTTLSSLRDHAIDKPQLSPYMEEQSSPEPDDNNINNYPESTINLQDLR